MTRSALLVAAVLGLGAVPARAFHSGGVGPCDGCHTMHNSQGGWTVARGAVGARLLQGSDPSSTCLMCHAGPAQGRGRVLTTGAAAGVPPANYTPGGDFAWLRKSFLWDEGGTARQSRGERHGHNVLAADFQLVPDGALAASPGGSYPAARLTCVSCHDPHGGYRVTDLVGTQAKTGKPVAGSGSLGDGGRFLEPTATKAVGAYRLLAGSGYKPASTPMVPAFVAPPPVALAPVDNNRSERVHDVRVAYGAGMSEWCANCHGALHTPSAPGSAFQHPSGAAARLGAAATDIYNRYVATGNLGGVRAESYTSLVPYEEGTRDRALLSAHARSDGTATAGPGTGNENVMCLSCHRAHASGWDHMTRWNTTGTDLATGHIVVEGQWPGIDATGAAAAPATAQGRTVAETRAAMYDRDPGAFAAFQKSLCNKCHGVDSGLPPP